MPEVKTVTSGNYPAALCRHRLHTLLQYVKIQYVKIIERQLQEKVLNMLYRAPAKGMTKGELGRWDSK